MNESPGEAAHRLCGKDVRKVQTISQEEILFPGFFLSGPVGDAPPTKLICLRTVYGDTLSGIASLFGSSVAKIARLNGIEDPDRIFPGQRLYVRVPADTPIPACDRYTVRPGDTLSGIAARFGLDPAELAQVNRLFDPDVIFPGQEMRI